MKFRLIRLVLLVTLAVVAYVLQPGRSGDDGAPSGSNAQGQAHPGAGRPEPSAEGPRSAERPGTRQPNAGTEARTDGGARVPTSPAAFANGEARVLRAAAQGESGFVTDIEARVTRLLADDEDGDRHQKFILELKGGHTLLVAHNIDLATRVPIKVGDVVQIRGEYEYNDRGGVLHWTHRANGRKHADGWIEHKSVRYW